MTDMRIVLFSSRVLLLVFTFVLLSWHGFAQSSGVPPEAAPSERFALLVGIDDYAQPRDRALQVTALKGPGHDVATMKGLLVDEEGFTDDAAHILTLKGSDATHAGILAAIDRQLIEKAKQHPGGPSYFTSAATDLRHSTTPE